MILFNVPLFVHPSLCSSVNQSIISQFIHSSIHLLVELSVSQTDMQAVILHIIISWLVWSYCIECLSLITRFYQLLAVYIFFLICFSIAILLRPLEVSCIIFVSHGEKQWVHLFWCSCAYNVDVVSFFYSNIYSILPVCVAVWGCGHLQV